MMHFRVFVFIFFLISPVICPAAEDKINVGVLAFRGADKALKRWQATFDYLHAEIPGVRFNIIPMSLSELDNAVIQQKIDFVITNPGQYVRIGSKYGMSWLATLKSRRHNERKQVIGSALIVKASSAFWDLDALRDKNLGAVDPLAFGGFQIYWGEMVNKKKNPVQFFNKLEFSHYPVDALVYWVRDEVVDAAVVPACLLEKMNEEGLIDIHGYRILEVKQNQGFNCQASSQLYPNWSFAKLRDTPPLLAEKIAKALLSMNSESPAAITAGSLGWTAPVSTYEIHQLYQRLNIHPWKEVWWQQAWRWGLLNWQWGGLLLSFIILGFFHHLWVQLLVNRRTHELEEVNIELHQQQKQLEHAQRIAILGELSSDLAHELNQPLAAINNYAEGGIVRLKKENNNQDLINLLNKISLEAQRSGSVIQRIRGFAKKEKPKMQPTEITQLINESLQLIQIEIKKSNINLILSLQQEKIIIDIDPIEIQQVLINLIRNSIEAMSNTEGDHELSVMLQSINSNEIQIKIIDNGPGIDKSISDQLFLPFFSTKKQGLGLGMSICKRIIEAHNGEIWIEDNPEGGCIVNFTLPGYSHAK